MTIRSLAIEFEIPAREISINVPMYVYKTDRLEQFELKQKKSGFDVQLAGIEYSFIDANNYLSIVTENFGGRKHQRKNNVVFPKWFKHESNVFYSEDPNIVVTNKFIDNGSNEIPLWYGEKLNIESESIVNLTSSIEGQHWRYDPVAKSIYIAKPNEYKDSQYKANYISIETDGIKENRLFNNKFIFSQMTSNDIDLSTMTVPAERPVYSMNWDPIRNLYKFQFNGTGPWFISYLNRQKLSIGLAEGVSLNEPWHLSVESGSYSYNTTSGNQLYFNSEYEEQSYWPSFPYRLNYDLATDLGSNIFKVSSKGMTVDPSIYLNVDICIYDEAGILIKCLTTQTQKIGKGYDRWFNSSKVSNVVNLIWEAADIEYDSLNCIVKLNNNLKVLSTDKVYVKYHSVCSSFRYTGLNFNPRHNKTLDTYRYYLIMSSRALDFSNKIGHIQVDYSGKIINSSLDSFRYLEGQSEFALMFEEAANNCLILAHISGRQSYWKDTVRITDIRLEQGIKPEYKQSLVDNNPWMFYDSIINRNGLKVPGLRFLRVKVDKEQIQRLTGRSLNRTIVDEAIKRHIDIGSNYFWEEDKHWLKIQNIESIEDNKIQIKFVPPVNAELDLFIVNDNRNYAIEESDLFIQSIEFDESNTVVTETIDLESFDLGNKVRLYIKAKALDDSYYYYSNIYEVQIND
jgi:hypothetical protein